MQIWLMKDMSRQEKCIRVLGVDTDKAIAIVKNVPVSRHGLAGR